MKKRIPANIPSADDFIERARNGEVFKYRYYDIFYAKERLYPFRIKNTVSNIAVDFVDWSILENLETEVEPESTASGPNGGKA